MKTKLMVSMIALAATMVSLSGCKDDDDDKKPSSSFTIDGSKVAIKTAFLLSDLEPSEEYHGHDLHLLSDGITVNGQTIEGKGSGLFFWIDTPLTGLEEGTYSYVGFDEGGKPFQIRIAAAYIDSVVGEESEESGGEQLQITSGEMTVSRSGDTYTIEFEGMAGEKTVTCSYTGPLLIKVDD